MVWAVEYYKLQINMGNGKSWGILRLVD